MTKINISVITRGHVSGGAKNELVNSLRDSYKRFGPRAPYKLDLFIAETESLMQDFIREEKFRLGTTSSDDEDCAYSFDVWRGYPRISVSTEGLSKFSKLARQGIMRHQAAHSALHGSLEFRIFKIPDDCRQVATVKNIDIAILDQVLLNVSIAVKDCEATKYLIANEFLDCQAAFALECLKPVEEDKSTYRLGKPDRQFRFIYLTQVLKLVLLIHPLFAVLKSKKITAEHQVFLGRKMEELVEKLPVPDQNKLLQVASAISDGLTPDTHQNVDTAMHHAMNLA
jgi:hypothetical protein